ncbi:PAP2-domain-containing protein [Leucogyrophana mollusca]|uniref:PAP2-domain-containing protein n=1 Tax=Leucogyrophana mollusca TaxID=85980 RepID=A0ACB8BAU4_9AGAM|nr:PAP2-domain-containing protein [Leucogyrophana mollusca]
MAFRITAPRPLHNVLSAFVAAVGRLDKSFSPSDTLQRLNKHTFTASDSIYIFHLLFATFWLIIMEVPPFPYKLAIPLLYALALLIPFTSQFFVPATPVFAWLLTFYSQKFIPTAYRPTVHVALLPTLESVLYGANISDILTRFTHPILDIAAWIPYGVGHYTFPLVLAAFLWLFRPVLALRTWAKTFGYMNVVGVLIQTLLPCSAPWYEVIYGLTPAVYGTPGSAGGLARIDAIFGTEGYQRAFGASPLVFGAFPSLHAAWATLEALFISHFFPDMTRYAWGYTGLLYWSTMYLTHHYLIDVVGGACLATAFFYLLMPDELSAGGAASPRSKYERYDLESRRAGMMGQDEFASDTAESADLSDEGEEENIMYRSPNPAAPHGNGNGNGSGNGNGNESAPPSKGSVRSGGGGRNHRHTASIASLIRADERTEGWSPIGGSGFVFPPVVDSRR